MRRQTCGALFHLSILFIALPSFAAWPTFNIPSTDTLKPWLTAYGCPKGQYRLRKNTAIKIIYAGTPRNLNWYWVNAYGSACKPVDLNSLHYNYYHQTGYVGGDIITIGYGVDENVDYELSFDVPIDDFWSCGPFGTNPLPQTIGCAQDMVEFKTASY